LCGHWKLNPSSLPLQKGGIPLFEKEGLGEILEDYVFFIMDSLIIRVLKLLMIFERTCNPFGPSRIRTYFFLKP